ncbi:hypothetical protein [Streptacidiphilus anmyonensis]|uniref:hypothetical protein n=1 Tax=Streptacidiphilus anmyonensis TaxID=405782 RepID=UPI000B193122|nr:hypothetical protein [Streptacidiphilus anmyonensis]
MDATDPNADPAEVETQAVLSLQQAPAAQTADDGEDDVLAHNSGLSVYRCIETN